jgi:hypothetical protein
MRRSRMLEYLSNLLLLPRQVSTVQCQIMTMKKYNLETQNFPQSKYFSVAPYILFFSFG